MFAFQAIFRFFVIAICFVPISILKSCLNYTFIHLFDLVLYFKTFNIPLLIITITTIAFVIIIIITIAFAIVIIVSIITTIITMIIIIIAIIITTIIAIIATVIVIIITVAIVSITIITTTITFVILAIKSSIQSLHQTASLVTTTLLQFPTVLYITRNCLQFPLRLLFKNEPVIIYLTGQTVSVLFDSTCIILPRKHNFIAILKNVLMVLLNSNFE